MTLWNQLTQVYKIIYVNISTNVINKCFKKNVAAAVGYGCNTAVIESQCYKAPITAVRHAVNDVVMAKSLCHCQA